VPNPPSWVTASESYFDKVELTWPESIGALSYRVYRHTTENTSSATAISGTLITTNFDDTTALTGVVYYYWVTANNGVGWGAFSIVDTGKAMPEVSIGLAGCSLVCAGAALKQSRSRNIKEST
jgi:hypothetical protein